VRRLSSELLLGVPEYVLFGRNLPFAHKYVQGREQKCRVEESRMSRASRASRLIGRIWLKVRDCRTGHGTRELEKGGISSSRVVCPKRRCVVWRAGFSKSDCPVQVPGSWCHFLSVPVGARDLRLYRAGNGQLGRGDNGEGSTKSGGCFRRHQDFLGRPLPVTHPTCATRTCTQGPNQRFSNSGRRPSPNRVRWQPEDVTFNNRANNPSVPKDNVPAVAHALLLLVLRGVS